MTARNALLLLVVTFNVTNAFADCDAPQPQPNESGTTVFYSISDLFKNARMAVSKELSKLSDYLRTGDELLQYKKMARSYAHYRRVVEATSRHFSIPEPFLACLFNKESSYDPLAHSSMDAKGIAQFTDKAITAFNKQIRYDDYSKAAWSTYPLKSGKMPEQISADTDVWNPDIMIPAGALRSKTTALALFGEFGADKWTISQLMILVAEYSIGPEGLAGRCKYRHPKTSRDPAPLDNDELIDACINHLNPNLNKKAVFETWDEMTKVSDCMIKLPQVEVPTSEPSGVPRTPASTFRGAIKKTF